MRSYIRRIPPDLVEISQNRTGMLNLISSRVPRDVKEKLRRLRLQQPNGVYIDPFLITCGF